MKDCILGVGTMTYYIEEIHTFGSLGHSITNDSYYSGEIYEAKVTDIVKPSRGEAGEKRPPSIPALSDMSKRIPIQVCTEQRILSLIPPT